MAAHHPLYAAGALLVDLMTTWPFSDAVNSGCGPNGTCTAPASSRVRSRWERRAGGPASNRLMRPRTLFPTLFSGGTVFIRPYSLLYARTFFDAVRA